MIFKEIYERYKNVVYNLALQYTQNVEDAEEITQDVFVKIYKNLDTFQQQSDIKTWIYRIAINQSLDFLKAKNSKKRWRFSAIFRARYEEDNLSAIDFNHPGVVLEQKESLEVIFRCIQQLPDNQKTVIILLKIEQMTQVEAGIVMNLSVKAVESLFQRAKKNLENLLVKNEGK